MPLRVGVVLIQNNLNGNISWIAGFYYIQHCLNAIASLSNEKKPEIIVFVPEYFQESILLPEYEQNATWLKVIRVPCDKNGYSFELQGTINNNPCDVFFPFTSLPIFNFDAQMIGWIPDFQHKYLPDYFTDEDILDRNLTTAYLLKHSAIIACSSQSVAKDVQIFSDDAKNKTAIVQFKVLIPASFLVTNSKDVLKKFNIERKYIILSNQFWIHKNHRLVFEAWSQLKKNGHDYLLVCTGAPNDYRNPYYFNELSSYIKDNKLEDMIRILGFIDRFDQIQLLRNAAAVLQPSLFEGWNTSIEEAKSLGKKLIISDIPVHREQCPPNAYFFNKNNPSDLTNLILDGKL